MSLQYLNFKKNVILFMSILLLFIFVNCQQRSKSSQNSQQQYEFYSNKDAFDCFGTYMEQCSQFLDKSCFIHQSQCAKQLLKQSCSFSQEQNIIHNGACFKQWQQKAIQTKGFVKCLNQKCNFKYNSIIALKKLQECTSKVLFQINVDCDPQCLEKIRIVTERVQKIPLQYAYDPNLIQDNQEAKKIIDQIKKNCISNDYKEYLLKWQYHQNQNQALNNQKQQILQQLKVKPVDEQNTNKKQNEQL